jgi:hypothetical protein
VIQIRTRTLVIAVIAFISVPILWMVVVGPLVLILLQPR